MPGNLIFESSGLVARVTLANPGKLNAIDIAMWRELRLRFEQLQALPPAQAPHAIVVRGADGQFASGGDIVEFAEFRFDEARLHHFHEEIVAPALHAMLACDIPTFAQVCALFDQQESEFDQQEQFSVESIGRLGRGLPSLGDDLGFADAT